MDERICNNYNGNGSSHIGDIENDGEESNRITLPTVSSSALMSSNRKSLQEPLTSDSGGAIIDVSDPFYVFREDLARKLEWVDEALAEYLRIVHQTVRRNLSFCAT